MNLPPKTLVRTTGSCEGCRRKMTRVTRLDAPNPGPTHRFFCSKECKEGVEVRETLRPPTFAERRAEWRRVIAHAFNLPAPPTEKQRIDQPMSICPICKSPILVNLEKPRTYIDNVEYCSAECKKIAQYPKTTPSPPTLDPLLETPRTIRDGKSSRHPRKTDQ